MEDFHQLKINFLSKTQEAICLLIIIFLVSFFFFSKEIDNSIIDLYLIGGTVFFGIFLFLKYLIMKSETGIHIYGQLESDYDYNNKYVRIRQKIYKTTQRIDKFIDDLRKSSYILIISFIFLFIGLSLETSTWFVDLHIQNIQFNCVFELHTLNYTQKEFDYCLTPLDIFKKKFEMSGSSIAFFVGASIIALFKK